MSRGTFRRCGVLDTGFTPDPGADWLTAAGAVAARAGVTTLATSHLALVAGVLAGVAGLNLIALNALLRARRRGRAGPLPRQLSIGVAILIGPVLVALGLLNAQMAVSTQDAALVAVIVGFAGAVGILSAMRLARDILTDLNTLRDGLTAVSHGDLTVRLRTDGGDELCELSIAGNEMIERLGADAAARRQSQVARQQLLASISHDLRTPITSMRLLIAAIDDRVVDGDDARQYARLMGGHVSVLEALATDLLELARLELAPSAERDLGAELVDVQELVAETVRGMRVHADAKRLGLRAVTQEHASLVRGTPEQLQRVLFNLIQNAVCHTPSGGEIVVGVQSMADRVEVEVADTGAGISPQARPLVFEPFYGTARDPLGPSAGLGLGLTISRRIVEAHGGEIWLVQAPAGARVRFSLPLVGGISPGAAPPDPAPDGGAGAEDATAPERDLP